MKIDPAQSTAVAEPAAVTPPESSAAPTAAEKNLATHRTAGGATGALVGALVAGPIGAVVGGCHRRRRWWCDRYASDQKEEDDFSKSGC